MLPVTSTTNARSSARAGAAATPGSVNVHACSSGASTSIERPPEPAGGEIATRTTSDSPAPSCSGKYRRRPSDPVGASSRVPLRPEMVTCALPTAAPPSSRTRISMRSRLGQRGTLGCIDRKPALNVSYQTKLRLSSQSPAVSWPASGFEPCWPAGSPGAPSASASASPPRSPPAPTSASEAPHAVIAKPQAQASHGRVMPLVLSKPRSKPGRRKAVARCGPGVRSPRADGGAPDQGRLEREASASGAIETSTEGSMSTPSSRLVRKGPRP